MIKYDHWLPKIVSRLVMPITAITIYPYILFTEKKSNDQLGIMRHEQIHLAQYRELWIIGFFIIYAFDYLKNRLKGYDHYRAYVNIRLEQEAYDYSYNPNYLYNRKPFAWRKFK